MKKKFILVFFLVLGCQSLTQKWQKSSVVLKNDRRLIWQNIPLKSCPKEIAFSLERGTNKIYLESLLENCVFLAIIEVQDKSLYLSHIILLSGEDYKWFGKLPANFFDTGWGKKITFSDTQKHLEIYLSWKTLELYAKDLFN